MLYDGVCNVKTRGHSYPKVQFLVWVLWSIAVVEMKTDKDIAIIKYEVVYQNIDIPIPEYWYCTMQVWRDWYSTKLELY